MPLFDFLFMIGKKKNWSLNRTMRYLLVLGLWGYYNSGLDLSLEELKDLVSITTEENKK